MPNHFQVTDTSDHEGPRKKVWVNFKPDIDLGHMIAMVAFLGSLFTYAQSFDRRMTIIEQDQKVLASQTTETKADIKEIKSVVNKIGTDLAVQNAVAANAAAQAAKVK